MSYDINEFPSVNGKVSGCIEHTRRALQRYIADESVLAHLTDVLTEALKANEKAFAIVQAHRYPLIANDLLEIHGSKYGYIPVACHNTLAT